MSVTIELLVGNDQTIRLSGLSDNETGDFINNATVTATIKEKTGVDVAGETWPLILSYEAGTDGIYSANLEEEIAFVANKRYIVEITATAPGDLVGFWRFAPIAKWRVP